MNPPNPFGCPQGGAFQAPNSSMKTGLFQAPTQGINFFQPSAFGQPPAMNQQTSGQGSSMFGQASAFGQSPAQPTVTPTTLTFGHPSLGMSSTGFGAVTTAAFVQPPGQGQSSDFGQSSAFGQAPGFGQQTPSFGKQPPLFGLQPSGFGNPQMTTSSTSTSTIGQPQPLSFGQSAFGLPSSTSIFGAAQSVTQSRGFGTSEFNFKPANEAVFKPIFSASPEPANLQTTSLSNSPFGNSTSQTTSSTMSSTTTSGFSLPVGAKSGPLGFSFSQPAAAPSIAAQSNPLTTGDTTGPASILQFTFSQPAVPSSSNTKTTEPTTPSSFSFNTKTLQPQPALVFGGTGFGQPAAFGGTKADTSSGEKESGKVSLANTNVFARLGKATKRKEDQTSSSTGSEKPPAEDDEAAEADSSRQPPKRPLMRSRLPIGGLFGRALSGIRKGDTKPVRKEPRMEAQEETPERLEAQTEEVQAQVEELPVTPSSLQEHSIEEEKTPEQSAQVSQPQIEITTPVRRTARRESSDSLSGLSPADCTTIQCRSIPSGLNRKDILMQHFSRFGKVQKIFSRPGKNTALIHFNDHMSAAKAKKRGKVLQNHELLLLWYRKKQSPGDKERRPAQDMEHAGEQSLVDSDTSTASSPLKRPTLRPSLLDNPAAFSHSPAVKKPPLAKTLQFDAEPQRDVSSDLELSERPVPSSLHHLIGQVVETSEDKYRMLEQRDKVLRQDRPKRTDLDMSKVFVGTCPDMCPEKERYMRETRKQLSVYEVIANSEMVDHAAAIKEYSRSSADQEEPLPHELRPLPVLSMTMDYLVTRIMDQGQDNYRDWYDFVWNRTRGIRKDITQQRLCCPATVSLIEKCTRFHVHCGHDLCEEQMSSFDAKINNENMTKCLQSLKEMYEDLAMRQVFCPQEAEFRQYSVLLKLNDGDILREVQQFREEVRNSPEVKFAVQAFAAVNNNNFVRFFKLVKRASYLASCLLHRYFNQVRGKALKTLNLAHTVGPRSTAFPLEDVARMLMFPNTSEATDFIQQYGLNVNEGTVELSRVSYQEPDLPLSQRKSDDILAKKAALIGEVVNGGPLPNAPHHLPVCSFDPQDRYRGDTPLPDTSSTLFKSTPKKTEVKETPIIVPQTQVVPATASLVPATFGFQAPTSGETGEPIESFQPPGPPAEPPQLSPPTEQPQPSKVPSPPPQPEYSSEDIMAEVETVIEEVVDTGVREVADAFVSYAAAALEESSSQVEALLGEVLGQMLQEVSSTEITLEQERIAEEKRKLEEARRKREHETFLTEFSFTCCREIMDEVLSEIMQETASSQIQEAVNEKAERVAVCTDEVCTELIEETLLTDIALLVEDVLDAELQCIHKYIKRWRDVVAVRRQLKRQMRGFPAAPCCVDPRSKLKALAPSAPSQPSIPDLTRGFVNLGNAGMLALSSTRLLKMREAAIHQMRVHYYYQKLLEETAWAPLHLPALLAEQIPNPPQRIFWKAVLLLPSDHDSVASLADRILSDWLEVKFGGGRSSEGREEQPDGVLQALSVTSSLQERQQHTHQVHISIKASRGPLSEDGLSKVEEGCELQGVGALLLLLPALPLTEAGKEEQDVPLLSALLQLKQLQQATSCLCPLPLVILVPGPDGDAADTLKLEEALMLHTLTKEGLISEYTFLFIPETTSDLQGTKQLNQAMSWLLARTPPSPPLLCQTLIQLMEGGLTHMFIPRVAAHCQERVEASLPAQDPAPVIQLYNALMVHVAERVSSKELSKLSWPPGEFCMPETRAFVPPLGWNSTEHLAWLQETILSLQLPAWEQPSDTDSWSEVCSSIFRYAAQIKVSWRSQPLLMSQLENLLERVRVKNQTFRSQVSLKSPRGAADSAYSAYNRIPWDEVLLICMDHKLKDWHLPRPPICEDVMMEDGEVLVYFLPDSLKNFQPPEEWTQAVRKTHREKHQEHHETSAASFSSSPPTAHSIRQRLFHTRVEAVESAATPVDITHTPSTQELLAHKVLQGLEEEKAESQRSMDQLHRWVEGEPLDVLSTPLFIPSSTLLSMPTTIIQPKSRDTAVQREPEEPEEVAAQKKTPPHSMSWRLKELQRQILASQEEELACRMELSGLLSIVDD